MQDVFLQIPIPLGKQGHAYQRNIPNGMLCCEGTSSFTERCIPNEMLLLINHGILESYLLNSYRVHE